MYAGNPNVRGFGLNTHLGRGDKDRNFIPEYAKTMFPQVSTDANAVLPWLEKWPHPVGVKKTTDRAEWRIQVFLTGTVLMETRQNHVTGIARLFPRAAVIALLRAKRAAK
jgi:hypothetical protein